VWLGPDSALASLQRQFATLLPGSTPFDIHTMAQRQGITLAAHRSGRDPVIGFAIIAVLVTTVGINGLVTFLVNGQRREIGIRLALGCRPARVFGRFAGSGARLVPAGFVLGQLLAAILQPWFASWFYQVHALHPAVIAGAGALLALTALAAIAAPALKAALAEPTVTLGEN